MYRTTILTWMGVIGLGWLLILVGSSCVGDANIKSMQDQQDLDGLVASLGYGIGNAEHWQVRKEAAQALGSLNNPKGINPLSMAVYRWHNYVNETSGPSYWGDRDAAIQAILAGLTSLNQLQASPDRVFELVACLAQSSSAAIRSEAALWLGQASDSRAGEVLTWLTQDSNSQVAANAQKALQGEGFTQLASATSSNADSSATDTPDASKDEDGPQPLVIKPIELPVSTMTKTQWLDPEAFHAIIIGIDYKGTGLPESDMASHDAKAFKTLLLQLGVSEANIQLFINEEATKEVLLGAIVTMYFTVPTLPSAKTILYFSGHASPRISGGEVVNGYLVPYDADPNNINATSLDMEMDVLQYMKTNSVPGFLFIDAAFSGPSTLLPEGETEAHGLPKFLSGNDRGNPVCILAATSEGKALQRFKDSQHGLFTQTLIEGFQGPDALRGIGIIDVQSLFSYIQNTTIQKATDQGVEQKPIFVMNGWYPEMPILQYIQ